MGGLGRGQASQAWDSFVYFERLDGCGFDRMATEEIVSHRTPFTSSVTGGS